MEDAEKPDRISLNTLIGRLREGRFAVPDFQREFEWQPWDVRDLMRSIFLDYYIGNLLLATVDLSTRLRAKRARRPSCGSTRCSPAH